MTVEIIQGDCREALGRLPDGYFHTCITSPPYWAHRVYGDAAVRRWGDWMGELGREPTTGMYVEHLVEVFREVRRVLRGDGTLWLNLGDTYATSDLPGPPSASGLKSKDLAGVPWRVALALQDDGWWLRSDIVWEKANAKPESAGDRPSRSHEYIFLLAKSARYYYDRVAIQVPSTEASKGRDTRARSGRGKYANGAPGQEQEGMHRARPRDPTRAVSQWRNKRTVWPVSTVSYLGAHYSVFPPKLIEPMILAGTSQKGCCSRCGAPLRRVVENSPFPFNYRVREALAGRGDKKNPIAFHASAEELERARGGTDHVTDKDYQPHTVGWEVSCGCEADIVPCRVLDPFGGSGTTALVAERLGRDSVLVEIKQEYTKMARQRLVDELGPLFTNQIRMGL